MSATRASSSTARFAPHESLRYTAAPSAYGWIAVAATARGLCWLSLAATKQEAIATLRAEFPLADLEEDAALTIWCERAVASVTSGRSFDEKPGATQRMDLRGTEFQHRVWEAIQKIPRGETRSYAALARSLGKPNAVRAVARACAVNRVALLVPCHRVIGATGALTGYRWDVERKRQLLTAEGARLDEETRASSKKAVNR